MLSPPVLFSSIRGNGLPRRRLWSAPRNDRSGLYTKHSRKYREKRKKAGGAMPLPYMYSLILISRLAQQLEHIALIQLHTGLIEGVDPQGVGRHGTA